MVYKYSTLEDTSLEDLHDAFRTAFSDYQVEMDLPFWKFENMLARRGFDPATSIGAFAGDELVGFHLNGVRQWDGVLTAYDTGTGVLPDHRRRGLTTEMLGRAVSILSRQGVVQYLLEVIQDNAPAVELYQKHGFHTTRSFNCYRGKREELHREGACVAVPEPFDPEEMDWPRMVGFWDYLPSWQNSVDSIMAVPESFACTVVRRDGRIVGYGIIERRTGDIPQVAVSDIKRGSGVGRCILENLMDHTESDTISVLNVDDRFPSIHVFVERAGFRLFTTQYEMVMEL